jgi:hypothetical protein
MHAVCSAMPVKLGMMYICSAPYQCPVRESAPIVVTAMPNTTLQRRRRADAVDSASAAPAARKLIDAGGPIRPGAAVARAPGASSKSRVSIPTFQPVRCSSSVTPPIAATNMPRIRMTGRGALRRDTSNANPATAAASAAFGFIVIPEPLQSVRR